MCPSPLSFATPELPQCYRMCPNVPECARMCLCYGLECAAGLGLPVNAFCVSHVLEGVTFCWWTSTRTYMFIPLLWSDGPAFLFSLGGLHRRYVRVPQSRWRRSGSCVRLMSVFRVACACFTSMATVRGLHFMAYISFFCILMSPLAGATLKNSPRAVPFVHEAAAGEGK